MSWYDVYDNMEVQRVTRKQAGAVTGIVTTILMSSIAALALGIDGPIPLWISITVAAALWIGFAFWMIRRQRRLRRVVWCIKLSKEEIVGYDYARRQITISWAAVERLEIGGGSLTVVGPDAVSLEITHLFHDFAQVSHRVMHYADRYNIPVFVDGKPWQQIDVYHVFPFLSHDASSTSRGSTAV